MNISKCERCTERCPQAEMAHEIAKGRYFATRDLAKCAPYWDILFDENSNQRIPPDHLRELIQAEKDGRLVVLPCKVGDTVWIIDGYDSEEELYVEEHMVCGMTVATDHELYFFMNECLGQHLEPFVEKEIGKTVFLTREEAEAALKGGESNA